MSSATCTRVVRRGLVILAAAAVVLLSRPAAADDAALRNWAHREALPRLATRAVASPSEPMRALGQRLATASWPGRADTGFWAVAGGNAQQAQFALATRIVLLITEDRFDESREHLRLVAAVGVIDGPGNQTLMQLLAAMPVDADTNALDLADAALDRGDFGLAALGYRLALTRFAPRALDDRDLSGHYLYCLHRLGVPGVIHGTQARFYENVVFPSIEAESSRRSQGHDAR